MKRRIYNNTIFAGLIFLMIFISSCEKDKIYPSVKETTNEFYTLMTQWYYWVDSTNTVDPANYSNPDDLLEAFRYLPKDKWSYITTSEAFSQYYEEGTYVGYGFSYAPDGTGMVRINFLFDDSELSEHGITRGWILKEINGTTITENSDVGSLLGDNIEGISNNITFESQTGEIVKKDFIKKLITMNTVASDTVMNASGKKVGYFVFKNFIGPSEAELTAVFNSFKTEQVEELVVDLRYNGGGQMSIVKHLAGYIIPDYVDGKEFITYEHNLYRSSQNQTSYFQQNNNSLRLDKVYFITGRGSASASEVIINSLEPYIDVIVVGDDTYGKPVGMYAFESDLSDLVYVPITFKLTNAEGFGGYYDGLEADSYVTDDILNDFGPGEDTFDEVLNHINTGSFSSMKSATDIFRSPKPEIRDFKDELGAI